LIRDMENSSGQVLKLEAMIAAECPLIILIVVMVLIDYVYGCK
jgi:hypothetical protein